MEPYRAPWWIPGGHLQTLASIFASAPTINYTRERWDTHDGDFIDIDWAGREDAQRLLVMFHGLEEDSGSRSARVVAQLASDSGWRFAMPHFRGCSGSPNAKPRAYHAGDSAEADWILRRFATLFPAVHAVGVSLGGNVLLKWLGEQGNSAVNVVRRAVAVSAPIDVTAFGDRIDHGLNYFYGLYFLRSLRPKVLHKIGQFPEEFAALGITAADVDALNTLPDFDDLVTAPLHGFSGKSDYWTRASALTHLKNIRVPTLILNARNDPFLPEEVLNRIGAVPSNVVLEFPAHGGHVGFPGRNQWLPRRVLDFLSAQA